jgi:predicted transposase YbfD/YdcC
VIVTINAMGTHPNIAQSIRDKEADYILAVKDVSSGCKLIQGSD